MTINETVGLALLIGGAVLLAMELVHPGALLLIPAGVLFAAGLLYLFAPNVLLDSFYGPAVVIVVALVAALLEIPYYRWVAPTHWPLSTTVAGLVGQEGTITTAVVPQTIRGKVRIGSEIWSAQADYPIPVGTRVRVIKGEGVSVSVTPVEAPANP
jgi:inner membrane protein